MMAKRRRVKKKRGKHRPIIGITCETNKLRPHFAEFELTCDYRYIRAVVRAGGIPVLLPINHYRWDVVKLLNYIDGVIIVGGADINPRFYGEKSGKRIEPAYRGRIYFEMRLYRAAQRRKIPVLAICHGMQLLNVIYGGTLHQDIQSEVKEARNHRSKRHPVHTVKVQPGSLCHKIFRKRFFAVHSEHHQAVKVPGRSLRISAFADDGTPETLEGPPRTIAVQWHPERQPKDPVQKRLFRYFIRLARLRRDSR